MTFAPKSSHFYSNSSVECAAVQNGGVWTLETQNAFYLMLSPAGICPAGTIALYRLYNNGQGGAPNHRYTDDLAILLAASRQRDALTLWHLLTRAEEGQRVLVYERLRGLAPPPAGVTKDGILRLDQPTLDLWWNELEFDDISVWRHWERSWSGPGKPVLAK